eukprot:TRINITY_DN1938_c0_g1_i1.p2 TRINITY_DN1938_c0_g1~~TRINITY_DN1938_c0_g1_i1.p2  ORF type:complete len:146 (-),score=23.31 TRINITY_DN1938_c0_g1_i1:487-882(-)
MGEMPPPPPPTIPPISPSTMGELSPAPPTTMDELLPVPRSTMGERLPYPNLPEAPPGRTAKPETSPAGPTTMGELSPPLTYPLLPICCTAGPPTSNTVLVVCTAEMECRVFVPLGLGCESVCAARADVTTA